MTIQRPTLGLTEAKKKIMDMVARRDHSEKEIRQKLSLHCENEIVEQALIWAQQKNWLASPESLKEKLADQLNKRGQGTHKINQKLVQMGLPSVQADPKLEFEKAKKLALAKWSSAVFQALEDHEAQKLQAKMIRFLSARGFTCDIISSVLKNEFKAGAISYDEEY